MKVQPFYKRIMAWVIFFLQLLILIPSIQPVDFLPELTPRIQASALSPPTAVATTSPEADVVEVSDAPDESSLVATESETVAPTDAAGPESAVAMAEGETATEPASENTVTTTDEASGILPAEEAEKDEEQIEPVELANSQEAITTDMASDSQPAAAAAPANSQEPPVSDGVLTSAAEPVQAETSLATDGVTAQVNTEVSATAATTNVALGKAVTSSQPFSDSHLITDGNTQNTEAYADSTPYTGLQWVQVDLEAAATIDEIRLWHYYGDTRQYQDVIVQLSNDAAFANGVTTVFNNDRDNTAGLGAGTDLDYTETSAGKLIPVNAVLAQFARFYANGNTVNGYSHYVDIQIFGEPTGPVVPSTNVALGQPTTSSQPFSDRQLITDGNALNIEAYADSTPYTGLQWVQVDLQAPATIDEIRLWHYYGDTRQYRDVIVQLSNDASFATGVTTVFNNDRDNTAGLGAGTDLDYTETSAGKLIPVNQVLAQFARFYANGNTVNAYSHYMDIQIYGESTGPITPTTNVALGKPVTSSQPFSASQLITDGNQQNTDAYADSTPYTGLQWVQVNLQAAAIIEEIRLWHYYGDTRQYQDVIVQLANDAAFVSGVTTVFNNDRNNTAGLGTGTDSDYTETSAGKIIPVNQVLAQYARFYANGNTVNGYSHYVDIQIYGESTGPITPSTNVALGKILTSSQPFSGSYLITDGTKTDTEAYADSTPYTGVQWVQVDLQTVAVIDEIRLWHYYGDGRQYQDVIVQLSNDAAFASGVTTVFNNDRDNTAGLGVGSDSDYAETSAGKIIPVNQLAARFVRFYANGNTVNGYSHYVEIEVYGTADAGPNSGVFLEIPTPYWDGTDWEGNTNQAVHPSVLNFEVDWNGYQYWMAFTPYPYADYTKENPSIVASHDGFNWEVPAGVTNPIVPFTNGYVAYNSDPTLFYRADTAEMEMWYRQVHWYQNTANQIEVIYRVKTMDGRNWTEPEQMLSATNFNILQYISPSIIYEDNLYKMWTMRDYGVVYAQSSNGTAWSTAVPVTTDNQAFDTWHPSVTKISDQYYLLNNDNQGRIRYSVSADGLNYSPEKIILEPIYGVSLYRASMVLGDLGFYVYYGNITESVQYTIWMAYGPSLDELGFDEAANPFDATIKQASGDDVLIASEEPSPLITDLHELGRDFEVIIITEEPNKKAIRIRAKRAEQSTEPSTETEAVGGQLTMTATSAVTASTVSAPAITISAAKATEPAALTQPDTASGADVGAATATADTLTEEPPLSAATLRLSAVGLLFTTAGSIVVLAKKRKQ